MIQRYCILELKKINRKIKFKKRNYFTIIVIQVTVFGV
jgi:hypothetical protein